MTPKPFGPRYPRRRTDILKSQILGVSVRAAEKSPRQVRLTAARRGLLEAIAAGKVRFYPSSGWKVDGKAVNAGVREVVAAGWAHEFLRDSKRMVGLTHAGEAALGVDGSESA